MNFLGLLISLFFHSMNWTTETHTIENASVLPYFGSYTSGPCHLTQKKTSPLGQRELENKRERSTIHTFEFHTNVMHHNTDYIVWLIVKKCH